MPLELLRLFAQNFGTSITASSRPAGTFFAVQLCVWWMMWMDWALVSDDFAWLVSPATVIIAGVLTVLEMLFHHDEDAASMMRDLNIDRLFASFGAFSAALLFASLGLPEVEAMGMVAEGGGDTLVATQTHAAVHSQHEVSTQVGSVIGSVSLTMAIAHYRAKVHEWLDSLELLAVWQKLESGGVLAAMILLFFSPFLMLGFLMVVAVVLFILARAVQAAEQAWDKRNRHACPACATQIRVEASLCHACGAQVTPAVWLTGESPMLKLREALWPRRSIDAAAG